MESLKSADSFAIGDGQIAKNQRIITHLPDTIAGIIR
jgi:hypothetical protein